MLRKRARQVGLDPDQKPKFPCELTIENGVEQALDITDHRLW